MPKYWGKQIFSLGRFPEVVQKQKTEKREREKKEAQMCNKLRLSMNTNTNQCMGCIHLFYAGVLEA